jgi:UDP-N-acetylglucosamine--N-acetylmuramyl-(pentapeptide) pyrophosphoryl-undecaprenol N-acetylglucosamine transferase
LSTLSAAPTLLIMAGGTGGHVFPGLAVAQAMRQRHWNVIWLGNPKGMEAQLVAKHDIAMEALNFGGLRGKGLLTKLMLPFNLIRACWQAFGIIGRVQPAAVLGFGGYITFPGGVMAALRGCPLVLHEQNSVAGLANKVLARIADKVLLAFPRTIAEAAWVGNPVRSEIGAMPDPELRFATRSGPLKVLVVGGSLGAQALNTIVPQAIAKMPIEQRPQVVHQSGQANLVALQAAYASAGVTGETVAFIDDMTSAYAEADLVICRAGAMTVSELACVGCASVLVPFPHAVDDHQTGNARFLADVGAAILIQQAEFSATWLAHWLQKAERKTLLSMAIAARTQAKPDAAEVVADVCIHVANQSKFRSRGNVQNSRGPRL